MFAKIDNWLFDLVFQPITDRFVARTGHSNYWLSGTCMLFYGAVILTQAILIPNTTPAYITGLLVMGTIFWARDNDASDKKTKPSHTRNPKRISVGFTFLRGFVLLGLPIYLWIMITEGVTTETILNLLRATLFTATIYFECCDTLPPPPPKPKTEIKVAPAT